MPQLLVVQGSTSIRAPVAPRALRRGPRWGFEVVEVAGTVPAAARAALVGRHPRRRPAVIVTVRRRRRRRRRHHHRYRQSVALGLSCEAVGPAGLFPFPPILWLWCDGHHITHRHLGLLVVVVVVVVRVRMRMRLVRVRAGILPSVGCLIRIGRVGIVTWALPLPAGDGPQDGSYPKNHVSGQ